MADVTVLTSVGEYAIVDAIDALAAIKYVAWGTGATGAGKGETDVSTEAAETATTRVTGTATQPSADKYQVVGTVTCAGAGKTITNTGLFDSATPAGAKMWIMGSFTGIPLSVGDSIQFTFQLEIT